MSGGYDIAAIATRLINAYDTATQIAPITEGEPAFDIPAAYEVLREIENRRRIAQGWRTVGRKIGFTNSTIWSRYGVYQPMWAHIWSHSIHYAKDGHATLALKSFAQPRIEPEVVFRLRTALPPTNDPLEILRCVEWIAPGFEIVQSHFPDWKFTAPDCTAAFGLHGALIVGTQVPVTERNRAALAAALPTFPLTLRKSRTVVDRGSAPTCWEARCWRSRISRACSPRNRSFNRSRRARSLPRERSPTHGRSRPGRFGRAITAHSASAA